MSSHNRVSLAEKELGRSVVSINPEINQLLKRTEVQTYFGVKNTDQIPKHLIDKLVHHPNFIWLTIDKASDKGRAIDTDLNNPLTYRIMTGSSSGGPINILKGINDFAIGTDGGGSILAPALSCQLPSIIGAGLGLHVKNAKISTDRIAFQGSLGVIGKSISNIVKVMELLTGESLIHCHKQHEKLRIVIPTKGSIICPDNKDMHKKIMTYLSKINLEDYELIEMDMHDIEERENGIQAMRKAFVEKKADLILTAEGPVDVYGYGETIPQHFGDIGKQITNNHGKYLVRAANMCQTTAITIPTPDLASGLVVISKKGVENARQAVKLAKKLEETIHMPVLWKRYFMNEQVSDILEF